MSMGSEGVDGDEIAAVGGDAPADAAELRAEIGAMQLQVNVLEKQLSAARSDAAQAEGRLSRMTEMYKTQLVSGAALTPPVGERPETLIASPSAITVPVREQRVLRASVRTGAARREELLDLALLRVGALETELRARGGDLPGAAPSLADLQAARQALVAGASDAAREDVAVAALAAQLERVQADAELSQEETARAVLAAREAIVRADDAERRAREANARAAELEGRVADLEARSAEDAADERARLQHAASAAAPPGGEPGDTVRLELEQQRARAEEAEHKLRQVRRAWRRSPVAALVRGRHHHPRSTLRVSRRRCGP